jgi:hypothetical protein
VLHAVSALGYTQLLKELVELGADVNCRDDNNRTPLHFACTMGDELMVSALLSFGADENARDKKGWSPLVLADCSGSRSIINLFADEQSVEAPPVGRSPKEEEEEELPRLDKAFGSMTLMDMGINTEHLDLPGVTDLDFANGVKTIQRKIRWWLYRRHNAASIVLQAATKGWMVRKNLKRMRTSATLIQSLVRQRIAQRDYKKLKQVTMQIQTKFRKRNSVDF